MRSGVALILFVCLCIGTGFLGSMATSDSVTTWYPTIAKPAWTPPDSVFAPVWTTLFVVMGIAAWLVWRQVGFNGAGRTAFVAFGLQLGLNLAWSILFFGLERPAAAFIEILLLWVAILATLLIFRRESPLAALLLAPYLGWVTFAALLNFAIWRLNT